MNCSHLLCSEREQRWGSTANVLNEVETCTPVRIKPGNKLQALTTLDSDAFVAEVKRIRGKKHPLTAASLQALRQEYTNTIEPARALAAEALQLECKLNDLVNEAYGLTPEEIELMWKTAPSRMPILKPAPTTHANP